MNEFDRSVFINCPFDDDYRPLLLALLFTIRYLDYIPRLALDKSDSSETRIDKILKIIDESKFGIHDLSRLKAVKKGDISRMNMPFELGIDFGLKRLKPGQWKGKEILVLEKTKYEIQKALSDLSGSDTKAHGNEPRTLVTAVRDWIVNSIEHSTEKVSGAAIWREYNYLNTFLHEKLVVEKGHHNIDDVSITEINNLMAKWFILKTENQR